MMGGPEVGGGFPRVVWFHRDYARLTGGHVKHAHYFDHVRRLDGFEPVMTFAGPPPAAALRRERDGLWRAGESVAPDWRPVRGDVLFVAGVDWRYVDARRLGDLPNPRIALVQGVRHAHPGTELHGYLRRRAVRICVSPEVADAIQGTGRVNGPVVTIANGTELAPFGTTGARSNGVTIVAYKNPALGKALSDLLRARRIPHAAVYDFLGRGEFLALLADSRVAVCLPRPAEGFYLPALEAMAAGCAVVTMDCVGNRGFCRPGDNCFIGNDAASLAEAVAAAHALPASGLDAMRARARRTVQAHALGRERARFHAVLADVDALWKDARSPAPRVPRAPAAPLADFMIVGAQKCGTTALWQFLGEHPAVGMSSPKEVHLFDRGAADRPTTRREADRRYGTAFAHCPEAAVRGEATPVYLYLPGVAARLKRYNPALKVIVMVRNPVDRAVSAYYMQKGRGRETMPFWLALLLESFRLRRDPDPDAPRSATREHGYRRRGLYSAQLANLYRHFPREQVLVVRTEDLRNRHAATLRTVFRFLGVSPDVRIAARIVFAGQEPRRRHPVARALLALSYLAETRRQRRLAADSAATGGQASPQPTAGRGSGTAPR